MNATLLVPGCIRMKPHSLCIGFLVSAWKALNLCSKSAELANESKPFLLLDWQINILSYHSVLNTIKWLVSCSLKKISKCSIKFISVSLCKYTASENTRVNSLHKVDDWLTHMAEVQCLSVAERFYGRKTAFSGFIRLPGTKKPFKR